MQERNMQNIGFTNIPSLPNIKDIIAPPAKIKKFLFIIFPPKFKNF